jgi:hypothetical protein
MPTLNFHECQCLSGRSVINTDMTERAVLLYILETLSDGPVFLTGNQELKENIG